MSPAWPGVVVPAAGPPASHRSRPARRSQVVSYHLSHAPAPYAPPPPALRVVRRTRRHAVLVTYSSRYIWISSKKYDTASGPMRRPRRPRYGTPTTAPISVTNGWMCAHLRDTIGRIT